MKIRLMEDNTIFTSDGVALNEHSPTTECPISLALREKFNYQKDYACSDCEEIFTFNGKFVGLERFPIEDGERSGYEKSIITPSDDLSGYSERVQTFCAIVFED